MRLIYLILVGIFVSVLCSEAVQVRWLEEPVSELQQGTAWGVPWPKGAHPQGTEFTMRSASG